MERTYDAHNGKHVVLGGPANARYVVLDGRDGRVEAFAETFEEAKAKKASLTYASPRLARAGRLGLYIRPLRFA